MHPGLRSFAQDTLEMITSQLEDDTNPLTKDLLTCSDSSIQDLRFATKLLRTQDMPSTTNKLIDSLKTRAYHQLSSRLTNITPLCWRRLYTDTCILWSLSEALQDHLCLSKTIARRCIEQLDEAIIVSGACGDGRSELILDLIMLFQREIPHYPPSVSEFMHSTHNVKIAQMNSCTITVPRLKSPPSFSAFSSQYLQQPFILPGFASDWPALNEHTWSSIDYLRSVSGPARTVPVEVGGDYRDDSWTQQMMSWDQFLNYLQTSDTNKEGPMLYLAQHNLFAQFPALRDDVVVPDYVYTSPPPPPDYPSYIPPANEDHLVMNVWLGPAGTISPAHTDPFFNLYTQIVGRKTIWLAPPSATPYMYPYSQPESNTKSDQSHIPAINTTNPSMSNTSRIDVFSYQPSGTSTGQLPLFQERIVPMAMCATLDPGDIIFFPPGWWHAMRSEDTSFSVSMWF